MGTEIGQRVAAESSPPAAPAARDLCRDRCAQREYECEIGGYDPNFCYAAYQNCIAMCI